MNISSSFPNAQLAIYGVFAGVFCVAFLSIGVFLGQFLFFLPILAALVSGVYFAVITFRFGNYSAIFALASIFLSLLMLYSLPTAVSYTIFLYVPIFLVIWLMGLCFYDEAKQKLGPWFSLQKTLFILILYIGGAVWLIGSLMQLNPILNEKMTSISNQVIHYIEHQTQGQATIHMLNFLENNFLAILLLCVALNSFAYSLLSSYIALRISQNRGFTTRPRTSWPDEFSLPPVGIALFFLTLCLASYGIQSLNLIYMPFLGLFSVSFILIGLSYIHKLSWGLRFRNVILALIYVTIFFGPTLIILLLLGLVASSGLVKKAPTP